MGKVDKARAVSRQALIVTGMHRSGTSAMTRTLSLLGAALPKDLLPGVRDDNELGFWEPSEVVQLHDSFLRRAGSSWDAIGPMPASWFQSDFAREIRQELLRFLEREFSDAELFVVKDPRISHMLPLWLSLLSEFEVEPLFVIMTRHPLEVAASLERRNSFPYEKSLLLWLWNLLEAERGTREEKRVFVDYQELVDDWREVINRLGEQLGVSFSISPPVEESIDQFLSRGKRPAVASGHDLLQLPGLPDFKSLFKAFRESAASPLELAAVVDDATNELRKSHLVFGPILADAAARLGVKSLEHDELSGQLAEKSHEASMLEGQLAAIRQELERSQSSLGEVREKLGLARAESTNTHQELERFQVSLTQMQEEVSRARAESSSTRHELEQSHSSLAQMQEELSRARAESSSTRQELEKSHSSLAQMQEELSRARAESTSTRQELEKSHSSLAQMQEELSRARKESSARKERIEALESQLEERLADLVAKQARLDALTSELREQRESFERLTAEARRLEIEAQRQRALRQTLDKRLQQRDSDATRLHEEVASLENKLHGVLTSRSWRLTSALRRLAEWVRGRPRKQSSSR